MTYADNGSALIDGVIVPKTEVIILKAINQLNKKATVSEIATHLKDQLSDNTLYILLKRLLKRNLVIKDTIGVEVFGRKVNRITWQVTESVSDFFKEHGYLIEDN